MVIVAQPLLAYLPLAARFAVITPVLTALVTRFGGGPVGLSTLAVAVGEEAETVEVVAEPFLVRAGLMARTPRGRVATPAAWEHLGLPPPEAPGPAGFTAPGTLFE